MAGWRERWFGGRRKPHAEAGPTGVVWNLRLERDRSAIGKLNDRIEQNLLPSVPDTVVRSLQVALDELLTNVIMHAGPAAGPIELQLARSAGVLDVTIRYAADRFDPTAARDVPAATSIADSQPGGLGIPLVRALMDEFRHEYVDGRNVVHLRKKC
jgi:anti-sigma regulatory factor (Ser/Thr protein kinase)